MAYNPAADGIRAAKADASARVSDGLGALWLVTKASPVSTLQDICFHVTPRDFALQVRGGLDPDEIVGWFADHSEATQVALQELHRGSGHVVEEIVSELWRNGEAYHSGAINFTAFDARNRELWSRAERNGVARTVAKKVNPL